MRHRYSKPLVVAAGLAAAGSLLGLAFAGPSDAVSGGRSAVAVPAEGPQSSAQATVTSPPPRFDHVIVVVFENKEAGSIIGNPDAPYFNRLARTGASFTQSFAVTHPSQPNYVALFSGSTHGLTGDSCPHTFQGNNEANELIKAGLTFSAYSENLPAVGSKVCLSGTYARKHAPWTNFPNVPDADQQPYTSFPTDYTQLPDVSWVIPNLCDDMHDCSVATGDTWLQANLKSYVTWAKANNSLLIVTFDEDDTLGDNRIATIFAGAHIQAGNYDEHITHYTVLRTIEDMYGVPHLGNARSATTIEDVWR